MLALELGCHDFGALETPGLRGVALTAPEGHGGSVPALSDAIELHRTAGMSSDGRPTTGTDEPWIADFSAAHAALISTFLGTMGAGDSNRRGRRARSYPAPRRTDRTGVAS